MLARCTPFVKKAKLKAICIFTFPVLAALAQIPLH